MSNESEFAACLLMVNERIGLTTDSTGQRVTTQAYRTACHQWYIKHVSNQGFTVPHGEFWAGGWWVEYKRWLVENTHA